MNTAKPISTIPKEDRSLRAEQKTYKHFKESLSYSFLEDGERYLKDIGTYCTCTFSRDSYYLILYYLNNGKFLFRLVSLSIVCSEIEEVFEMYEYYQSKLKEDYI